MRSIEVESDVDLAIWGLLAILIILASIFTLVGAQVTPENNSVLTYTKWQNRKLAAAADEELAHYQDYLTQLETMVAEEPDPIQASLLQAKIIKQYEAATVYLPNYRDALLQAAQDIKDWSMGIVEKQQIENSLLFAHSLIEAGQP